MYAKIPMDPLGGYSKATSEHVFLSPIMRLESFHLEEEEDSTAMMYSHRIHGTGIFTYIDPMKIHHSWISKYTSSMDPMIYIYIFAPFKIGRCSDLDNYIGRTCGSAHGSPLH